MSARESSHQGGALRSGVVEDSQVACAGVERYLRAVIAGVQENVRAEARPTVLAVNLLGSSGREKASAPAKQEHSRGAVAATARQGEVCDGGWSV